MSSLALRKNAMSLLDWIACLLSFLLFATASPFMAAEGQRKPRVRVVCPSIELEDREQPVNSSIEAGSRLIELVVLGRAVSEKKLA